MINAQSGRLRTIDALRGAAALSVLAYHLTYGKTLTPSPGSIWHYLCVPIKYGYTGVGLFLVLSGFCIHLSNTRPGSSRPTFVGFWKRRLFRLYPPYLAAIAFSIFAGFLGALSFQGGASVIWPFPPYESTGAFWFDIFAHVFMLHNFFPTTIDTLYNPPLWSLALEEQLYLLYWPFLGLRRMRGTSQALLLAFLVSLIWNFTSGSVVWRLLGPARWFEWALGTAAAEAYCGQLTLPKPCRHLGIASLLWLLGTIPSLAPVSDMLFGTAYFILTNWAIHREVNSPDLVSLPLSILSSIGTWSYSLYLMHMPLLKIGFGCLAKLHLENIWLARLLFMPTLALFGSWTFFQLVERHFLHPPRLQLRTPG